MAANNRVKVHMGDERETKTFLVFLASFEQISLQKETFDFLEASFEQPFWEVSGNFFVKSLATCANP